MKMKPLSVGLALTASLLTACSQAPDSGAVAQPAATDDDMAMPAAEHAQMAGQRQPDAAQPAKSATATGTVESVDATAGKITIAHGPVEALQWPAMTMAFKATPEQVASVQPGQKVEFAFESKGMDNTITRIAPME